MGANNVLPTVPTFTAGAPTLTQLNQLSYAVSFLADQSVRPYWSVFSTATQAIAAATWTTVAYNQVAYDSDGVTGVSGANLPSCIIVTQGMYALEACVQVQADANTGDQYAAVFLFTAGANNPHYALNTNVYFGPNGDKMSSTTQAAADNAVCISDLTPAACYPGDKLAVQFYATAAKTLDFNRNTSYIQGRFATKFSGYLYRTGS